MLSLGAVAYDGQENQVGTWYATLAPLPDCYPDPGTLNWWDTQPEAKAEVFGSRNRARDMIPDFGYWCEALPGRPIAVAWPAVFDFGFTNYYCHRFFGRNPLGYDALRHSLLRQWAGPGPRLSRSLRGADLPDGRPIDTADLRPHIALDDAIGQGRLFLALRRLAMSNRRTEKP